MLKKALQKIYVHVSLKDTQQGTLYDKRLVGKRIDTNMQRNKNKEKEITR